jgi:hypothetical protein
VVQQLETLWEASDHLCGKRLAAVLPTLMTALESHGHWQVDPDLRQKQLQISPATIDRLLAIRADATTTKRRLRCCAIHQLVAHEKQKAPKRCSMQAPRADNNADRYRCVVLLRDSSKRHGFSISMMAHLCTSCIIFR